MTAINDSVPSSTYRLQFGPNMTFEQAAEIASYLADLGVGALYASPILQAAPGSTHGYDVVDPTIPSADLGGETGRDKLVTRLGQLGLGLVVDVVPNHMGIAQAWTNRWWWDVLRHGRASRYAGFFDIDWESGPLLVPVLEDDQAALADLTMVTDELHGTCLAYYEHRFPLAADTERGSPQEVHERQHYRLVSWRRANTDLNYRRFFDITTLAAVRVENPEVFAATHETLLRWVADGGVTGIRIDHPDGLADPGDYLRRLNTAAPGAWLLVEKILGPDESLPTSWPVAGTTGYESLREVCGVFVDPAGEAELTTLAEELCGPQDLHELEYDCKRSAAANLLRAEVRRIARLVPDVPQQAAEEAVVELLSNFPIYRSYLPEGRAALETAAAEARRRQPELATAVDTIVERMITGPGGELAIRLQQTSGMVMAKGVEDTAFYRYNRFVALNEVGGDPSRFGVEPAEFHARCAAREAAWPATMTTLSTHDTKRSEDVRANLAVLTEIPDEFADAVRRWTAWRPVLEPTLNLLAWQTVVCGGQTDSVRLRTYLRKAAREAKIATSWTDPNPAFDKGVDNWPLLVITDDELVSDVNKFGKRIRNAGWSNSLGQKLLQLAGPGVPDVYQGTELWDYSLVDPDNRRPVSFELRRDLLKMIDAGHRPTVSATGAAKLLLVRTVLRLRRDRPELFRGYRPLTAEGPAREHAIAFARGAGPDLVAVATRLPIGLRRAGGWRDTVLPLPSGAGRWRDVLTGEEITDPAPRLATLLARYPVALLVREA